jgi:SAM-dependent methyltransferase
VTYTKFERDGVPIMDIQVNGVPHQQAIPAVKRLEWESQYGMPYERAATRSLDDVLIVGAGSGTDVAIALSKGAKHVDAVEIDPKLRMLGGLYHPDKPYDDPRVTTQINDGRAFLERTGKKYDLILFALPDSLTLVSGASSLRLESYLFTEQAMRSAREHLKPGGAFSMYNYYREIWLMDRLAATAQAAFGHKPCVDVTGWGQQAVITAGLTTADQICGPEWAGASADTPAPTSDDRPFLYLHDASIPTLYLITLGLILLVSLIAVRVVAGPYRQMRPYADLFLLGAGFLLLETKNVTGFALLFGTTWVVNAIVFAGVLIAVLAAVEVTRRFRTPSLPVMYGVILVGLAIGWLVPNAWLLSLATPLRLLVAVTIAFLPIFAANVVFAKRFAGTADGTVAFGANLLGAMVGGCLEYAALVVGYNALLIVAGLLYLGAFILLPRTARAA